MRSFAFILTFITSVNLFAQINVYKPFPETNGQWEVERNYPKDPNPPTAYSWTKYVVSNDTTIGAFTYNKVDSAASTGTPSWNGTQWVISYGPSSFCFAYRNDIPNKRVYFLDVKGGLNKDTLWYDFNLNVGDTLENNYSFKNPIGYNHNPRRIVQSIDSILICGQYHKKFKFSCPASPFDEGLTLIEGAGFSDMFIQTNFINCPFEPTLLYSTEFSTCVTNSLEEISINASRVNLYPNPTSDNLSVSMSTSKILEISLYDIKGSEVLKSEQSILNIGTLSKGPYLIKVKTDKGEFSQKFIKE